MSRLTKDLRFVLRQLYKSPGFALTVLITLALGITATTVIFSLVDAVLLRPLPLPESGRLMALATMSRPAGSMGPATIVDETSYPNFFDWRSQNQSFSSMATYNTGGLVLGADKTGPARRVLGVQVSSDFFTTLGVAPELGRGFVRDEELPGARPVVLSHDTWKTMFASDRDVLGKPVVLSDISYTVVGVMPPGFAFPVSNTEAAFWITMSKDAEGKSPAALQRGYNQVSVVGRLRPGVSVAQARAEMDAIQRSLAARYPEDDQNEIGVRVVPELQDLVSDVKRPLHILFGAVCCLLLIVCANVAGLLLTRTSQRRGELAIRAALGATRFQIIRQLLVESLLLSLGGGVLGLALTLGLLYLAPRVLPANLPRVSQVALNGEVMVFAMGISLLTGLMFGVLPAWRASKLDPAYALGESGRSGIAGRRHYRLQSALVVSQTALGLVLLVGAGLLIHSFDQTLKVDPGFTPDQVLTFRISVPVKRYSEEQEIRFIHDLILKLNALPGVQKTSAGFPLPLAQSDINISFSIAGRPTRPGDEPSARASLIEPEYFQTLRIPLKSGRFFLPTEHDAKGPPAIIINEALAHTFFPGVNPVGQHIRSGLGEGDPPPMREVVGVVGNVKRSSLTEEAMPEYYIPYEQAAVATPSIAMRVTGDPNGYARMVTAEVAAMDKSLPIYRMQSYSDDLRRVTAQQRFQTLLLTGFAAVALLLAGLGLYAVLSYMVSQRTTELGLRIALGAGRGNVLQLMLWRGLGMAALGLIAGLIAAGLLTRFVAGLLFGVKPLDIATFTIMTLVLLAVSAIASFIPSLRAAMLDPNKTLRQQ